MTLEKPTQVQILECLSVGIMNVGRSLGSSQMMVGTFPSILGVNSVTIASASM